MHGAHGLAMLSNPDDYDGGEPVARQAKYAALEDCNEIYACTKRSQPAVMSAGLALAVQRSIHRCIHKDLLVVQRIGSEHDSAEKLFAHHRQVYAWFTELPMKVGLIAYRTERRRMRSTQQCDLSLAESLVLAGCAVL